MRLLPGLLLAALLLAGCVDQGQALQKSVEPAADVPAAGSGWASPQEATVFPGAVLKTQKRDCPSNFVFTRADNGSVFLGTSAYCVRDMPLGTMAMIGGPDDLAVLVYSSWVSMEEGGETDRQAREYNDFAVFYIDSSARSRVSPAIPVVGGPQGAAEGGEAGVGSRVRFHSQPPVTGLPSTAPAWRDGVITGQVGAWALLVHSPSPALPGGTGGAALTADGRALGVVVNLGVSPSPAANGIARLDALLGYARDHANLDMVVATP